MKEQHGLRLRQRKLRQDHKQLARTMVDAEKVVADLKDRATGTSTRLGSALSERGDRLRAADGRIRWASAEACELLTRGAATMPAEIQMLKFGQIVDLELVDKALQRKGDEEIREEMKKQERQLRSEAKALDRQVAAKQEELAEVSAGLGLAWHSGYSSGHVSECWLVTHHALAARYLRKNKVARQGLQMYRDSLDAAHLAEHATPGGSSATDIGAADAWQGDAAGRAWAVRGPYEKAEGRA